jgi:myo-inositol-1(or 4)-monophosphatase
MTEIELIAQILEVLGPYVRERRADRENLTISSKSHANDLLTEVDIETQRRIVARIGEAFPGDLIVGEEEGYARYPGEPGGRTWIIDPIDGTQNFVRSLLPEFGISIAFARGNELLAGGVAFPGTGDVFLAERGSGAEQNGRPIRVSEVNHLSLARVELDFDGPSKRQATLDRARSILLNAGQVRCHCAAVLGLCSIASGDADAYVHVSLRPWDYAASLLLAEEAGGASSSLSGDPLQLFGENDGILVSTGRIHAELLAHVRRS